MVEKVLYCVVSCSHIKCVVNMCSCSVYACACVHVYVHMRMCVSFSMECVPISVPS